MNYTWDLSILYSDFESEEYKNDSDALSAAIAELSELSACAPSDHACVVREYTRLNERIAALASKLSGYASLRYYANTRDNEAASRLSRLMGLLSESAAPQAALSKLIAGYDELEEIIDADEYLSEHRYLLLNLKRDSKYLLSEGEETVLAKMNISGAQAWEDLQSALTSGVKARLDGEELTLSTVRNLAYDSDPDVRRRAYEAELECYGSIKDAVAFALNSIKHQVICECELRGYESPLQKSLYTSRMKRETLDALMGAMEEFMPEFHRYLRAKAHALGHGGGLPWYDLFAPMGESDKKYTVEEAKEYLLGIFSGFDGELCEMVRGAFENRWIDFFPREGKVGGAFDYGIPSAGQSRVLTNFDGAFSDIVTLAHELGHSFHDKQVFKNSVLNQEYSMPVAETASTFNEVLVMNTAIPAAKSDKEKLALLEGRLMDCCQIICDIYSRYLFETAVFENRKNEFLSAERLCELMLEAQKKAYGDGIDDSTLHPYMWLCKSHYYSGSLSFYNFPYAFGGLFATGLYAKYKAEGEPFIARYKEMLQKTPLCDIEQCAAIVGAELCEREFWREGLRSITRQIDEFCELVGY